MRYILLTAIAITCSMFSFAQDSLFFELSTGSTEVFYTSNLDSITFNAGNALDDDTVLVHKSVGGTVEILVSKITSTSLALGTPVIANNPSGPIVNGNEASVEAHVFLYKNTVLEMGYVYGLSNNPTVENDTKVLINQLPFETTITGLPYDTYFHFRAFVTTDYGTFYGLNSNFATGSVVLNLPAVVTHNYSGITTSSASIQGEVTSDGGAAVTERGFVYGTTTGPTALDNKQQVGTGTGSFSEILNGLAEETTYYVRSYAVNSEGTAYGNELSFTTLKNIVAATVSTNAVTSIEETSASISGEVTDDGNGIVSQAGFCWSTTFNPTISDDTVNTALSGNSFSGVMSGLTASTLYYVRAFATNEAGTSYGNQVTFRTSEPPLNVSIGDETGGGYVFYVTPDGTGALVVTNGVSTGAWSYCWDVSSGALFEGVGEGDDNLNEYKNLDCSMGLTGPMGAMDGVIELNNMAHLGYDDWYIPAIDELVLFNNNRGLLPVAFTGTQFSLWSSTELGPGSVNCVDWSDGSQGARSKDGSYDYVLIRGIGSLTTNIVVLPELTVHQPNVISFTATTAEMSSTLENAATPELTERGICYNTSGTATTSDSKSVGSLTSGLITNSITGLTPNTTYYFRAYAIVEGNTVYSDNEVVITTRGANPTLITGGVTDVTGISAKLYGTQLVGTDPVTEAGIVYGLNINPTIADNVSYVGVLQSFNTVVTSLSEQTVYHYRAFATTANGTFYGGDRTFTTTTGGGGDTPPSIAIDDARSINENSARITGQVTAGTETVTQRGIVYSTSSSPNVVSATKIVELTNLMDVDLTGLTSGTSYYVRGYATTASGTYYSNEISFTTSGTLNTDPVVSLNNPASITQTTAAITGSVSPGTDVVIERGVVYSTSVNPDIVNSTKVTQGTNAINLTLAGLLANTVYHVRAYATTASGTFYSAQVDFVTVSGPIVDVQGLLDQGIHPFVIFSENDLSHYDILGKQYRGGTIFQMDTINGGGYIVKNADLGNAVWNPSSFGYNILLTSSDLSASASNTQLIVGEYGASDPNYAARLCLDHDDGQFSDWVLPASGAFLEMDSVLLEANLNPFGAYWTSTNSNSSSQSAISGLPNGTANKGISLKVRPIRHLPYQPVDMVIDTVLFLGDRVSVQINSDGGSDITQRGICWSESPNPDTSDFKLLSGVGSDNFISSLRGELDVDKTYYLRSFAITSWGVSYSGEKEYHTKSLQTMLSDNHYSPLEIYSYDNGYLDSLYHCMYQGGLLFHLDVETGEGIVVFLSESTLDYPKGKYAANPSGNAIVGTTDTIYSGISNTTLLRADCDVTNCIVDSIEAFDYMGFTDWYIPSRYEVEVFINNSLPFIEDKKLNTPLRPSFPMSAIFWTSSEKGGGSTRVWAFYPNSWGWDLISEAEKDGYFYYSGQGQDYAILRALPVRKFNP